MLSQKLLFPILILAICITQFASDIYAPCMPAMAEAFGTSMGKIQGTMAIYMLGVALTHLIAGPLSEGFGRKKPITVGLFIMLLGSALCARAQSIEMLMLGRFIQGCGAGACACLWRAVFRDIYSKEELSQRASHIVMFIMFVTPSAPLLGGYLQSYFGWRANFNFMFGYVLVALLGVGLIFQETNKSYSLDKLKLRYILGTYAVLLKSRIFMGITAATFLSYGASFSWFVVSPALLIQGVGLMPTSFGWLSFGTGLLALSSASYLNGRYVKRFGMPCMLHFGWSLMLSAGLIMGLCHLLGILTLWSVIGPMLLFYFGSNFIWPNVFATAFTPFGHIAGYAGALYGFMQICGAATISGLISYLPDTQLELSLTMLLCSSTAWGIYAYFVAPRQS